MLVSPWPPTVMLLTNKGVWSLSTTSKKSTSF
ncbi:hypothetical protein IHE45_06G017500 [Dioscorea alata]|uniref:Uncharacterized protein n=1 Tax=Dioscorea alata TaxID=55571 RepID=A0ACB7VVN0_DIOAL|nr:hypothetical protein IHE45_06G017500 [Dioscorea alata]